ncbi:MAG: GAP family protein [Solirubrobacterales bacterium]
MIQTFLLVLPFALAGAVSPMMLTEQTLLLAGPGGRTASRRFAMAAILVLFLFVGVLIVFGRAISLPHEPSLDANLDILIGCLLVLASMLIRHRRQRGTDEKKERRQFGPGQAFGFGAFSMATNFTSLALVVPAAKVIAASDLSFPQRDVLAILLVLIVATPAWLPLALTAIAPGPAESFLVGLGNFIERNGRALTVLLLLVLGLVLIGHGIIRLA